MYPNITHNLRGLVLAVVLFTCGPAFGAPFSVSPALDIKGEYNDNIFFSDQDPEDDWITTLSPGLVMSERTERFIAGLEAFADQILFLDHNALNSLDYRLNTDFSYQMTPRLSLGADAGYKRDSRSDADIEESGLVLSSQSRDHLQGGVSGQYWLAENTLCDFAYGVEKDTYEDPEFMDSCSHQLSAGLVRQLDKWLPRTRGRIRTAYGRYDFEDVAVDNYQFTLGTTHEMSEVWQISADVGGRYTRTDYAGVVNETSSGLTGRLTLTWTGEKTRASVGLSREMGAAGKVSGAMETTSAVLEVTRDLTETASVSANGGYYTHQSDETDLVGEALDEETWRLGIKLRQDIRPYLRLEAGWRYAWYHDLVAGNRAARHLVFVLLGIEYDLYKR